MILRPLSKNSFGVKRERAKKSIGLNEKSFANRSPKGVWVLRIYLCSIMVYWRNRHEGSYMTKHLCFIGCLSPNTFQTVQSWMQANPSFASYAWRSIIWGREVIKKGAIWRIGDGKFVDIWVDRWLPRKYSPRVLSSRRDELTDSKVCSLIDRDQKQWKTEVLENILLGFEAEII